MLCRIDHGDPLIRNRRFLRRSEIHSLPGGSYPGADLWLGVSHLQGDDHGRLWSYSAHKQCSKRTGFFRSAAREKAVKDLEELQAEILILIKGY